MAPSRNADREAREARERLRRYRARQGVYTHQGKRRRRDNILAIAGIVVVAALATLTQVAYFTAGPGMPEPQASASPSPSAGAEQNTGDVPSPDIAEGRTWTGELDLNDIPLGIEIDGAAAPQAASVFISLTQDGYYQNNACHRLTTTDGLKVVQCGQPGGESVDPGFQFGPIENAPADGVYPAGTIAMARAESTYSNSTQFFITYGDSTLPTDGGGYTVFGRVTSGLDQFVAQIASAGVAPGTDGAPSQDGAPAVPTTITSLTLQ